MFINFLIHLSDIINYIEIYIFKLLLCESYSDHKDNELLSPTSVIWTGIKILRIEQFVNDSFSIVFNSESSEQVTLNLSYNIFFIIMNYQR